MSATAWRALVAVGLTLAATTTATAAAMPLRVDRWTFSLSGGTSRLTFEGDATVEPGQLGVFGFGLGLRETAGGLPVGIAAPYLRLWGGPKVTGVHVRAGSTALDGCAGPLTCSLSADGRTLHFRFDATGYDYDTMYVFLRAARCAWHISGSAAENCRRPRAASR